MLLSSFVFLFLTLFKLVSSVTYSCNRNAPCGCSTNSASVARIVGGEDAGTNTWGWAVSLLIDNNWICGGSLLSSSWILTAAHCVTGARPNQVLISAATNELLGWEQWRYASAVIIHPQYNQRTSVNDIALIKVSRPFNMTDPSMAKVCLPTANNEDYPPTNSTLVTIGWGRTTENGDTSDTLRQVALLRISTANAVCIGVIEDSTAQFCAGAYEDGKDSCQGDSGGPLMIFTPTDQWAIVGIVSYGYGCAHADSPGVYTRVIYYLDWIRSMNVTDAITVDIPTTTTYFSTAQTTTMIHIISSSITDSLLTSTDGNETITMTTNRSSPLKTNIFSLLTIIIFYFLDEIFQNM